MADLVGGVRNVIRWTPVIWFDADYDWAYLASIMEYKLRRSAALELQHGHHLNSKRDGRNMLICAEILKRLQADEYYEHFVIQRGRGRIAAELSQRQSKNEMEYLGKLIGKHLTHWWD